MFSVNKVVLTTVPGCGIGTNNEMIPWVREKLAERRAKWLQARKRAEIPALDLDSGGSSSHSSSIEDEEAVSNNHVHHHEGDFCANNRSSGEKQQHSKLEM